jgi:hypothetical protein
MRTEKKEKGEEVDAWWERKGKEKERLIREGKYGSEIKSSHLTLRRQIAMLGMAVPNFDH